MKPEDKDLLLKDICSRLPYGVFMGNKEWNRKPYQLTCDEVQYMMMSDDYEDVPYLRPMSSMTEEEKLKFSIVPIYAFVHYNEIAKMDWLNEHHFDYRGLIDKGLAIEVTEENNPYKD